MGTSGLGETLQLLQCLIYVLRYTLNLTQAGTCTVSNDQQVFGAVVNDPCVKVSNATSNQIINPVRSARLTTAGKKTIRYGRVEISAKMPAGDWLWPAIW